MHNIQIYTKSTKSMFLSKICMQNNQQRLLLAPIRACRSSVSTAVILWLSAVSACCHGAYDRGYYLAQRLVACGMFVYCSPVVTAMKLVLLILSIVVVSGSRVGHVDLLTGRPAGSQLRPASTWRSEEEVVRTSALVPLASATTSSVQINSRGTPPCSAVAVAARSTPSQHNTSTISWSIDVDRMAECSVASVLFFCWTFF